VRKLSPTLPPDHPEVVAEKISELERKVERLRTMYETFFSGADRRPPNTPRRELNRLMLELQQLSIRNAGLRFRFQTLSQRWTLYTTYWNRTLREIEAGTYRKDLAKVQRRLAQRGQPLTEHEAVAMGIPLSRAKAFVEKQNRYLPAPPVKVTGDLEGERTVAEGTAPLPEANAEPAVKVKAPAMPPPPPPARRAAAVELPPAVAGISDEALAALQLRYNEALRRQATPRPPVSIEKLRSMLAAKTPDILRQHNATRVDFEVATKDGRVVLKAKPVK
jgi:hypothetical protein